MVPANEDTTPYQRRADDNGNHNTRHLVAVALIGLACGSAGTYFATRPSDQPSGGHGRQQLASLTSFAQEPPTTDPVEP